MLWAACLGRAGGKLKTGVKKILSLRRKSGGIFVFLGRKKGGLQENKGVAGNEMGLGEVKMIKIRRIAGRVKTI